MQKIIQNSSDLLTLVDIIQQVTAKFQEKINGTELESNYDVKYALERIDDEFSNIKRGIWAVLGAASKYQQLSQLPLNTKDNGLAADVIESIVYEVWKRSGNDKAKEFLSIFTDFKPQN